ncbi:MAG: hypothetical protein ACOCVF_04335 [bacterium]
MPTTRKNEQESDFISRCIPIIIKEKEKDKDEKLEDGQAYAICKSIYKQYKNK